MVGVRRVEVDYAAGNGGQSGLGVSFHAMDVAQPTSVGNLLREWRQRRRMSQLELACEAEISTRHLSFVETGRSRPSREMLLQLAERLEVPLRERNLLLLAAGFAPVFPERSLEDPALQSARQAVDLVLAGHQPYPALAIDRRWTLVAANNAVAPLLASVDPALLAPPVNVLKLSLHPAGLASRIANFTEWRGHLHARLRRDIDISADPFLVALLDELRGYPRPGSGETGAAVGEHHLAGVVVPFRLETEAGLLSFFSTTTIFGTPLDVTLSELAIESFFPADAATAERLRRIAERERRDDGPSNHSGSPLSRG
jgi:transcriptional regulator with XRE-family HTH domain